MNWQKHIEKLQQGYDVAFRPKGNSMLPRIHSGNLVTVSPNYKTLKENDIVFCRVKGHYYVHLIKAIRTQGTQNSYQIGNNKGGINGWIFATSIYGKVIRVEE